MAMDYTSTLFLVPLGQIKTYLSVDDTTDDDVIGFIAEATAQFIDSETNRNIIASDVTEYHDGDDTDAVMVNRYPINTAAASMQVWVDPTGQFSGSQWQVPTSMIAIDSGAGMVFYVGGEFEEGRKNVKLSFNGGWTQADVPADLKRAFLKLIAIEYRLRSAKEEGKSSITRDLVSFTFQDDIPSDVQRTIKRWRRPRS